MGKEPEIEWFELHYSLIEDTVLPHIPDLPPGSKIVATVDYPLHDSLKIKVVKAGVDA